MDLSLRRKTPGSVSPKGRARTRDDINFSRTTGTEDEGREIPRQVGMRILGLACGNGPDSPL